MSSPVEQARYLLENRTPLAADCGQVCGHACCRCQGDEPCGMRLFPGEEALLRRNYLTYLTGRIRFLNARLGSLAVGDTEGRVVRYLLSSLSYGAVECSASGLARQLGISRASVYRAFQDLEQAGLIRREAILVPDPAALEGVRGSG